MSETTFASRRARELADELGVDAEQVDGSGQDGAITVGDIRAVAADLPEGLGDAGASLWRQVLAAVPAGFALDRRDEAILALAARQADDLAALETVIDEEGTSSIGSAGQRVVHPAVLEARQSRQAIGRLLAQLPFPDEAGSPNAASQRGRRAAQVRWSRRGSGHRQAGALF